MGQKRTNPRKGIETHLRLQYDVLSRCVRKERIPVRGLKRETMFLISLFCFRSEKNESP